MDRQAFGISDSKTMDDGGLVVGNEVMNIERVGEAVVETN
jgi:hypothetical protein